ncbi:hypothetical protein MVEN_01386700 [Mycena venus]|uniref:Uncharacterized protein n=1 Tax=Mycena venus TaxID=2733690 RepID=A0A8H6XYH3_9AGAR|nr:hypothetical protein MVEN_01386700 [Mycena venus]
MTKKSSSSPRPPRSLLEDQAFFSRYSHSAHSSVGSSADTSHSGCSSPTSSGPPATPTSPTHSVEAQMQMLPVRPLSIRKRSTATSMLPFPCTTPRASPSAPISLPPPSSVPPSPRSSPSPSATVGLEEQEEADDEYYAAHAHAFVTLARPPLVPVPFPLLRAASAASPVSAGGGAETSVIAATAPSTQKGSHPTSAPSARTLCESGAIPALPAMSTDTRGNSNAVPVRPTRAPPPPPSAVSSSSSAKLAPSLSSSHLQNSHLHPTTGAASNSHPHARATFDANANPRLCAFKFPDGSAHDYSFSHSPSNSTPSQCSKTVPPTATNAVFSSSCPFTRVAIPSSNSASPSSTPTPSFSTEFRFSLDANTNSSAVSSLDFPSQSPFPSPASVSSATARSHAAVPNFSRPTSLALALLTTAPSASVLPRGTASPVLYTAGSESSYSGRLAGGDGARCEEDGEKEGELAGFAADYAAYAPLLRTPTPSPCVASQEGASTNLIPVGALWDGHGALRGGEVDAFGDGEWDASILYADEDEEERELSPLIAPAPAPFPFAECSSGDEDEDDYEDAGQRGGDAAWRVLVSGSGSFCVSSSSYAPSFAPAPAPELRSRWSSSTLSSQHSTRARTPKAFSFARRYLGTGTSSRRSKASNSKPARPLPRPMGSVTVLPPPPRRHANIESRHYRASASASSSSGSSFLHTYDASISPTPARSSLASSALGDGHSHWHSHSQSSRSSSSFSHGTVSGLGSAQ